jgi:hypothetical protein
LFIPDPDPDFLPIPDPRSRGQKGTGSRIRNADGGLKNKDNFYFLNRDGCRQKQVSWDPPTEGTESHFDTLLRSLVISRLGRAEDPEVRAEAKRRFDLHASGETPIKADIRSDIGFQTEEEYSETVTF